MWALMDVEAACGMGLTESCSMLPAASVSGLYFAGKSAQYFGVGKIQKDQVQSYAARKGASVEEVERWLGHMLKCAPPGVELRVAQAWDLVLRGVCTPCACKCVCACMCVRACVCVCVSTCVRARAHVPVSMRAHMCVRIRCCRAPNLHCILLEAAVGLAGC